MSYPCTWWYLCMCRIPKLLGQRVLMDEHSVADPKDVRKRPIASKGETAQAINWKNFFTNHLSQDALLVEEFSQVVGVELVLVWHHLQDASQVGKKVPLVSVCENRRHASIVELDVLEVNLDKVDGRVVADEGDQSRLNGC